MALKHISENREAMDEIVEELLEVETMDGARFREVLAKSGDHPGGKHSEKIEILGQIRDSKSRDGGESEN